MRTLSYAAMLFGAVCVFASCSSGDGLVDVIVDKVDSTTTTVVIDDTMKLQLTGDTTVVLRMKPGTHTVAYKSAAKQSFDVSKKGGLLNLDNTDYVVFEVLFEEVGAKTNFSMNSMTLKAMILVDSFVIIPKMGMGFTSDSTLRNILPKLQASENGTYYAGDGMGGQSSSSTAVHGLRKISKGKLFIDKFWDYNTINDIPETIEIRKAKYSVGKATETKKTILDAQTFLLYALFDGEQYTVRSLESIRQGANDAAERSANNESVIPED